MALSQKVFVVDRSQFREEMSPPPKNQLKAEIDFILQSDFTALNNNPKTDHHSLLTKHNNSLLLNYVRQIYHEYNITDPLPNHYSLHSNPQPQLQIQLNTSQKRKSKIHLYSSQVPPKFATPDRQQRSRVSQHIRTEPTRKLVTLGPASVNKELEQRQLTIKKETGHDDTALKASNSYFLNKSVESSFGIAYNEVQSYNGPQRLNLSGSRKYEKGKEMRIQVEEPFQNLDEGIQINSFNIPFTPSFPNDFNKHNQLYCSNFRRADTEPRTIPPNGSFNDRTQNSAQNFIIKGADTADSRLMIPYPLPQIMRNSSSKQEKEIKDSFRYCIGCEKALLQANIRIHEKGCSQFQRVLTLSSGEIIEHLKLKIRRFEKNIQLYSEELIKIDPSHLEAHSQKMMAQSLTILGEGHVTQTYEREYGQIMEVMRKWCLMTEEINKVNWFLKIRQRVKKQLQI